MSRYLPYILGQNPEIDSIITKVISEMKLQQDEVRVSKLEDKENSGSCNIGVFLLSCGEAYRTQWIIKIESDEESEAYPDIQTINVVKFKYPAIEDSVILPILVGQMGNLEYSVMKKAYGRSLYDLLKNDDPTLKLPSFYEFDSYDSYVSNIEWRFEQCGEPMTSEEVKGAYYRVGQALGKLHNMGVEKSENDYSAFRSKLIHNQIHRGNIFVSANNVQFIDNSMLLEHGASKTEEMSADLGRVFDEFVALPHLRKPNTSEVIKKYYIAFFQGYISTFENKIACVEYLQTCFAQFDKFLYEESLIDQLSSVIDSIVANEECNNNCNPGNLVGDNLNEAIVSE